MKNARLLIGGLLMLVPGLAAGQALSYDPYYVLPGEAEMAGADLRLASSDVTRPGDATDIELMGKYSLSDRTEVGVRAIFGFLNDRADALSGVTVGAQYGPTPGRAFLVNITPLNDRDGVGLSLGVMQSGEIEEVEVNARGQLGLFDGYAPEGGVAIDILLEPVFSVNEQVTAYLDALLTTDTEKPAGRLSLLLGPGVDVTLSKDFRLDAGIRFSLLSGKWVTQDTDLGLIVSLRRTTRLR